MITPYDDKEMVYSGKLKKYVLTPTAIIRGIFLDKQMLSYFKNMSNADLFLEEMSEDIYRYILQHKFIFDRDRFQQLINTDEKYREPLKRAMMYQVRYAFRSSGHTMKDMTGIDIERGRLISLDKLRGDVGISPSSIEELKTAGMLDVKEMRWR